MNYTLILEPKPAKLLKLFVLNVLNVLFITTRDILSRRFRRYCFHTEFLLKTTWTTRDKFVLNVLDVLFISNTDRSDFTDYYSRQKHFDYYLIFNVELS